MSERIIKNILLVCLDDKFIKDVSASLAEKLDLFFVDCGDMIEYDITNSKDVVKKCGFEYLKKRERGVLSGCADYENTVLSLKFEIFSEFYDCFKYSLIVFVDESNLNLNEKEMKEYKSQKISLSEVFDVTVKKIKNSNTSSVVENIYQKLQNVI